MNRMPWIAGIVLALFAGFAIGRFAMSDKGAPASARPFRTVPATDAELPDAAITKTPASIAETQHAREIEELNKVLKSTRKELEEAKAELAKRDATAAARPTPPVVSSKDQEAARDASKKAIEELAGKGLYGFMSPENHKIAEQLGKDLAAAGDLGIALLDEMLASNDSSKRFLAVAYLSYVDKDKALPLYRKALADGRDDMVRRMASHTLATQKVEKALPDLQKAMKEDKDWGVRVNSAYGVAKMGGEGGLDAMMASYKDASHSDLERIQVLGGIADVADPSTAPLFRDLLATSKDDSTLSAAIYAVEKMKDKASLGALQAIVQNGSNLVKEQAKKAYNSIYGQEVYR